MVALLKRAVIFPINFFLKYVDGLAEKDVFFLEILSQTKNLQKLLDSKEKLKTITAKRPANSIMLS